MDATEYNILMENLKAEGRRHIEEAHKICASCEHVVTVNGAKRCSFCCCPIFFKVVGTKLEKSTCPKNKW